MDEKRLEVLEARVEKLDRLVYRLFKSVKQLSPAPKEPGEEVEPEKAS